MSMESNENSNQELVEELKRKRQHLAERMDDECIEFLEARFETHLPAFQGRAGQYDPLDAMRRDAHREVILYLKHIRKIHNKS